MFFGRNEGSIVVSDDIVRIGNSISQARKDLIDDVYNMFGKLGSFKLRSIILSKNSPAGIVIFNPEVLLQYMTCSLKLPNDKVKEWFINEFLV